MGLVSDVQTYLVAQGLVDGTTGWPSKRRHVSDHDTESAQLVVVTEDGGPVPTHDAASGLGSAATRVPGVQVFVRGEPFEGDEAFAKAQAIYDALHSLKGTAVGASTYVAVQARTPEPVFIGYDDKQRPQFTISFLATVAAV